MDAPIQRSPSRRHASPLDIWLYAIFCSGVVSYVAYWLYIKALADPEYQDAGATFFLLGLSAFMAQCFCASVADRRAERMGTDNGIALSISIIASILVNAMVVNVANTASYGAPWHNDVSAWLGLGFLAIHVVCLWRARRWHSD